MTREILPIIEALFLDELSVVNSDFAISMIVVIVNKRKRVITIGLVSFSKSIVIINDSKRPNKRSEVKKFL